MSKNVTLASKFVGTQNANRYVLLLTPTDARAGGRHTLSSHPPSRPPTLPPTHPPTPSHSLATHSPRSTLYALRSTLYALRSTLRASLANRRTLVIRKAKGGEEGGAVFGNDAFGMVAKNANYMLFAAAADKTGCKGVMTGEGPLTVFAPNDTAFEAFIKKCGATKMTIMEDPNLEKIVKSHIVEGTFKAENLTEGTTLTTIAGTTLTVSGGAVNGSKMTKNDIKVDNAVLHAVSAVIEA